MFDSALADPIAYLDSLATWLWHGGYAHRALALAICAALITFLVGRIGSFLFYPDDSKGAHDVKSARALLVDEKTFALESQEPDEGTNPGIKP